MCFVFKLTLKQWQWQWQWRSCRYEFIKSRLNFFFFSFIYISPSGSPSTLKDGKRFPHFPSLHSCGGFGAFVKTFSYPSSRTHTIFGEIFPRADVPFIGSDRPPRWGRRGAAGMAASGEEVVESCIFCLIANDRDRETKIIKKVRCLLVLSKQTLSCS